MKEDLKNQIIHDLVRDAYTGAAELQAYLTDTGSLKDSAAQLAPVTVDRTAVYQLDNNGRTTASTPTPTATASRTPPARR